MALHRPVVSVVIPCYNAAPFLRETLESALNQTHPPLEVIVVDDGSTDDSAAIARSFGPRVRVVRQENQGESVARNRAMDEAHGEWIAFLDSDDLWKADKLALQLAAATRDQDVVCVHGSVCLFGRTNGVPPTPDHVRDGRYDVETLIVHALISPSTALVKRSVPVRFPEWTRDGEDMIYFAEVSEYGRIEHVAQPIAMIRTHATQQTRSKGHVVRHFGSRLRWTQQVARRLGDARAAGLQQRLRDQLCEHVRLARWQRKWDEYWKLREFAGTLDWDGHVPPVLQERVYPKFVYQVRDLVDRLFERRQ
jgi:glycosyltransferase involved in cell wall biosynthesis